MALVACWPSRSLSQDSSTPLKEAAAFRAEGRFGEALELLRTESREIKRVDGDDSLRLLPVNDLAVDILLDQGSLDAAESLLGKTLDVRQALVDSGQREHAVGLGMTLARFARLHTSAKRFPQAVASAQRALTICDQATAPQSPEVRLAREAFEHVVDSLTSFLGPSDDATLEARDQAAASFESLGMFTEAIEQRRRLLDALRARDGAADAKVLAAGTRLCRLMMLAGRAKEAIPLLKELLASAEPGTESALAALSLQGELQLADEQLIAADASCTAVLEASRAILRQPTCTTSGDRLRRILIALRRQEETPLPDWFAAELRLLAKPPPMEAAAASGGLVVAADILLASAKPDAAADELAKARTLAGSAKPPSAELVAHVSGRLTAALLAAGRAADARKIAEPAVAAAERALGPGDGRVAFLRVMLADAVRQGADAQKAGSLLDETLARGLPRPDDSWEQAVIQVFDRWADGPQTKEGAGAGTLRDRYVAARAKQFGTSHPHVAKAWSLFGAARLAAGDWTRAADYFSRSLTIQQATLGEEHPEVAANLALLAHAERAGGNPSRSADIAGRALAIWEKVAGRNHPGTLAAADVLVSARLQAGDTNGVEELLQRLIAADSAADPVRHAGHLVRLAGLIAPRDKNLALEHLQTAMELPCWKPDATLRASDRLQLASSAARAAQAYETVGDSSKGEESLRKARSLALQLEGSDQIIDQIERLAAGEGLPRP